MPKWFENEIRFVFEYDEAKSRANKEKHGIDFEEAQLLWLDDRLLRRTAITRGESRFVFIGRIGDRHWSAIATYRGDAIRLISVRRSRAKEVQAYGGK